MPDRDVKTIHDLIYPVRKSRRLLSMVDSYDRLRHKAMIIRYLFSNGVNYHYTKIIARRAFSAQDGKAAKAKRVQSAEFRVQSVGAALNGKYCAGLQPTLLEKKYLKTIYCCHDARRRLPGATSTETEK